MEKIMNFVNEVVKFFEMAGNVRAYGELKFAGKETEAEMLRKILIEGYSRN
jgi:hypothetical protein